MFALRVGGAERRRPVRGASLRTPARAKMGVAGDLPAVILRQSHVSPSLHSNAGGLPDNAQ